eukprot:Skav200059  [mRNA]  locus=scaffold838:37080:39040:+ [translate_table: standard]
MPSSRSSGTLRACPGWTTLLGRAPAFSEDQLLFRISKRQPQELAKLRMFIHYFDRCRREMPRGELRIYRDPVSQVRDAGSSGSAWKASRLPLLEMKVAPDLTGFEDEVSAMGCNVELSDWSGHSEVKCGCNVLSPGRRQGGTNAGPEVRYTAIDESQWIRTGPDIT